MWLLRSLRLRTEMPELDVPPHTPNSSTVLGSGQHSPPASCPAGQQLPVKSVTWPVPLQAPHASSWPLQHAPELHSVALPPAQHDPSSLTTPAFHHKVKPTLHFSGCMRRSMGAHWHSRDVPPQSYTKGSLAVWREEGTGNT